jgi:glycosyltransferase involved in cell wall biosynthesis
MTGISVIVPVFNQARRLGDCLDALLQQNIGAGGFVVIVVDNRSSDDSMAVARQRPAVRLLSEPSRGAYAARNRGIRAAQGALVAFTDADCIAREDWLSRLQERLVKAPEAMVVMGRDIPTGPSNAIRLLGLYDHYKEIFALSSDDPTVYYGHTNCMMTRRDLFDQLGFFDPRPRGADVIFVQRVLARHGTRAVQYEPDAVVNHMEVRSAPVYFKKAFVYGRSARAYRRVVPARPLRNRERWQIFRNIVRGCKLPAFEQGYLLILLAIGVAAYGLGWLSLWRGWVLPSPPPGPPTTTPRETE